MHPLITLYSAIVRAARGEKHQRLPAWQPWREATVKRSPRFHLYFGIFFVVASLIMLALVNESYSSKAPGGRSPFVERWDIVLATGLFWAVGCFLGGRETLRGYLGWADKVFIAIFLLTMGALSIGLWVSPVHSSTQTLIHFTIDLMIVGACLFQGVIRICYSQKAPVPGSP